MTTYSGHDFWVTHPTPWRVAPLRRLGALGTGHTPSRSQEEYWQDCTVPWVTTEDLTSRVGTGLEPLLQTRQQISELGLANSAAVLHPPDTVMLSRTASVGHVVRIGRPMATTQAFATWTCGRELDPRYLLLVLNAMQPEFERIAYGSTHLTIYMPDIEQIRVPVPPMETQRAIADFLHTETARIDALIAKKRRIIDLLGERRWSEFRLATTETDAPRVPARRALVSVIDGPFGSAFTSGEYSDDGVAVIRLGNIGYAEFRDHDLARLPLNRFADFKHYAVRQGDVLFAGLGDERNHAGRACVAPDLGPAIVKGKCFCGRVDTTRAVPDFIAMYFSSPMAATSLASDARGSTRQMINLEILKAVEVPLPSVEQQMQIVEAVRSRWGTLEALNRRLDEQIRLMQERRQALITAAVTGELEVPGVAA